jgi:adhesin transport system membrane fusion protein
VRIKSFVVEKAIIIFNYCHEHFDVIWIPFKTKIEKLFHLTEHSAIRTPRVVVRVSILLFGLLFLWALFFHIDQVVHAQGQVIADARTQIVQSADGGVLVDIKIKEGESVKEGQILAIMEKSKALAGYTESYGRVSSLKMTVARLQALISEEKILQLDANLVANFPDLAATNQALFKQQRLSFKEQVKSLEETKKLTDEELARTEPASEFFTPEKLASLIGQ